MSAYSWLKKYLIVKGHVHRFSSKIYKYTFFSKGACLYVSPVMMARNSSSFTAETKVKVKLNIALFCTC